MLLNENDVETVCLLGNRKPDTKVRIDVVKMFTTEELQAIDAKYFIMIVLDPYDLIIQSKCTGHYWYLHSTGYPSDGSCIIFSTSVPSTWAGTDTETGDQVYQGS